MDPTDEAVGFAFVGEMLHVYDPPRIQPPFTERRLCLDPPPLSPGILGIFMIYERDINASHFGAAGCSHKSVVASSSFSPHLIIDKLSKPSGPNNGRIVDRSTIGVVRSQTTTLLSLEHPTKAKNIGSKLQHQKYYMY